MQHIILNTVLTYWQTGRRTKKTSHNWVSGNAVCCPHRGEGHDTRSRGGILFSDDAFTYSCFNCGFKTTWRIGRIFTVNNRLFLSWLGISSDDINKLSLHVLKERSDAPTISAPVILKEFDTVNLPPSSLPMMDWINAGYNEPAFAECVEYVYNRGFNIDSYPWHWSPENGYYDRVIIPYFYKKKIVGWTARKVHEGMPKYLNCSQAGYLFNIDAQTYNYHRNTVIVVEGILDALAIDGVAVMHNTANEKQCELINNLDRQVILVPDKDRPGAKLIETALENKWAISIPPWNEGVKDVADAAKKFGPVYTLSSIMHYKETNRVKIEIYKKKLQNL